MGQRFSTSTSGTSYDRLETLGQGSFGVVYKEKNRYTNEVHAVKQMQFTLDVTQREKFSREVELLKRTRVHGNIVSLIGSFIQSDSFFIVMEFCELGDLNHYVMTTTNVSVDSKVLFMYDMSNGLHFMHQINIVHRDMKPANVLVTKSHGRPVCKISDLGEARMHASDSDTLPSYLTSAHGTMAYIAPEVLQGHYTKSCDVFSLGVIFYALFSDYEIMYLNPLVDGQCMYEARDNEIQNAVKELDTLPTELRDLTLKMLKKDYKSRVECGTVKATLTEARGNSFCILL